MYLEIRKFYKTREGNVVFIKKLSGPDGYLGIAINRNPTSWPTGFPSLWTGNGRSHDSAMWDLVEEINDPVLIAFLKVEYENRNR